MKKYISFFAAAILLSCSFFACQGVGGGNISDNDKIQIVTTIFPEYDWVMNILGENPANAEVTMLLDNGIDLHNYQPTAQDIMKISQCDVFVYVGGESDEWVEDVLKEAENKDMKVINLLEVLGDSVKEEEVVEGMQEECEHDHEHAEGEDEHDEEHEHEEDGHDEEHEHEEDGHDEEHEHHHEEGEIEYDEHVWLSLSNAVILTESISESIQEVDPSNAELYKKNTDSYVNELKSLDEEYREAVSSADKDTILFGDRFPFRYLADDYDLNYYAAFVGCSAETEASFETVIFLAKKIDELSLNAVLTIEGDNHKIAETIVSNTQSQNQQILVMDSMQSTTSADVQNGASYLEVMKNNLSVLKEALK